MIISKLEFSGKLGVTPGRISQFLKSGMPEREDGALDFEVCLKWVTANISSEAGERADQLLRSVGSARPSFNAKDDGNPVTRAVSLALGLMFATIPTIAKGAAREAGASAEVLEKVAKIAHRRAIETADEVSMKCLGQPPREWA